MAEPPDLRVRQIAPGQMQDDLVERVAKAICQERCAHYGEPACWKLEPKIWPNPDCDCGGVTIAAIAAMREPTDAMFGYKYGVEPRRLFTEMIDTALQKDAADAR